MEVNKFFQSKSFQTILAVIGTLAVLLLVFSVGVFVGFRKARFSYGWGENYSRVFGGPQGGFFRDFEGREFINSHGIFGTVIKIDPDSLVVKSGDNVERVFHITPQTTVQKGHQTLKITDLKVDDRAVVIGSPRSDGSNDAKFIRIFDESMSNLGSPLMKSDFK